MMSQLSLYRESLICQYGLDDLRVVQGWSLIGTDTLPAASRIVSLCAQPEDGFVLPGVYSVLTHPSSYNAPVPSRQVQVWEQAVALQDLDGKQIIEHALNLVSLDLPPGEIPPDISLTRLLRQFAFLTSVFRPFVADFVLEFEEDIAPELTRREYTKMGFVRSPSKPGNLGPLRGRLEMLIERIAARIKELGIPLTAPDTEPWQPRPDVGKYRLDSFEFPEMPVRQWNP
jgi:hypothetical protein